MPLVYMRGYQFLSTPSGWRATIRVPTVYPCSIISIHALRVEGDIRFPTVYPRSVISIHALRVEGDYFTTFLLFPQTISIHALRVEGDVVLVGKISFPRIISIHALRVEGDARGSPEAPRRLNFYPRPPGGGRLSPYFAQAPTALISIHALRVEGDQQCPANQNLCTISIHALRVEGDSKNGQSFRLFLRKREKNLPL